MRILCAVMLGVVVVTCAGTAQAQDDYAKKIVGTWEVTKADEELPVGTIIEFTKDGKLNAVIKADGAEIKLDGTYSIAKEKLSVKVKVGDQDVEETITIKKLTDDALEVEGKDKKMIVFKKKK